MKLKFFVIMFLFVVVSTALAVSFIAGCGTTGGGGASRGDITYFGTQSPGDSWSWVIGSGTFIGTNETSGEWFSGTYSTLPSGFNLATVLDSSDSGAIGGQSYFIELLNTALIVKPMDDKVIVCAAAATQPPAGGSDYPYIKVPNQSWATTVETSYGISTALESGGVYTFEVTAFNLLGGVIETSTDGGYTFSNGKLTKPGSDLEIYMTPSGVFIGDEGANEGGFAGALKYTDPQITIDATTGKIYKGVNFHYKISQNTSETDAIGARPMPGMSGVIQGWTYTSEAELSGGINPDTLTQYTTLEFSAPDSNGFVTGILRDTTGYSSTYKMLISDVGGKYLIFGISVDGDGDPQNFVAIQTN